MALKAITINTDTAQDPHIYAIDDAEIFNSIIGGEGVHNWEENFAAEIIDNNTVRIKSGVLNIQGHFARTGKGEYTDIAIENGSQTLNRNDLIVAEFRTDSGIDNIGFKVIKGEPSESAKDPVYVQEDLLSNGLVRQLPLYRVVIDKLALTSLQPMFSPLPTLENIKKEVIQLNEDLLEKVYPVGSIYISVNNTNPGNIFGGIWERFANGRTLVGVDENDPDFNIVGKSGGSKNVALNIKQIPTHSHQESDYTYVYTEEHPANNSIVTTNQNGRQNINANIKSKTYTKNAGGGEAHSNLQPYIAIFYWIRRK